jgi:hypothetical protein
LVIGFGDGVAGERLSVFVKGCNGSLMEKTATAALENA